jgi:membrane-associated phospholipid phosphatase
LEKRKHHLSDVMAGASAGFIVGRTVSRRDKLAGRLPAVSVSPGPQGGMMFSLAFGVR